MVESVTGLFYVILLIARLVALYSSQGPSRDVSDPVTPGYNRSGKLVELQR